MQLITSSDSYLQWSPIVNLLKSFKIKTGAQSAMLSRRQFLLH